MRRAVLALVLAATAAAAPAADDVAQEKFRRAELLERGLGQHERAAQLYREAAAAAPTPEAKARAEIRAAACLRRLGRADDARALAAPWAERREGVSEAVRQSAADEIAALAAPGGPAAPSANGPRDDVTAQLAERERELERMREELDGAVEKSKVLDAEAAALARRVLEMDAENARLRAQVAPPDPTTTEEVLEAHRRAMDRRRRDAENFARTYLKIARLLHQEGRFEEARDSLYRVLERDPDNPEAKALLARVSAPLGEREALYRHALDLHALAREVRSSRRAAEVAEFVDEARRRQDRGDYEGSAPQLEKALAWLDALPDLVRSGSAQRELVARMLAACVAHGVPRAPATPPPADPAETEWTSALRKLLADAGGEVEQGLEMRFHDLGPIVAATGLPPVPAGPDPAGWTIATSNVPAAPLLAAWLRATEPAAFATPGAALDLRESTCIVLADPDAQHRIHERLVSLRLAAPGTSDVQIGAYRADAAAVAGKLAARGVTLRTLDGGARAATLGPADLESLLAAMPQLATGIAGICALRTTPLRPFRLSTGVAARQLVVDAIAIPATRESPRPGVAVRAEVSWTPADGVARTALRAEATAGAVAAPGGGLVVFGIPDPSDPTTELTLVVRIGNAQAAAGAPLPPPAPNQGADELRVPASVASVEDPPSPPLLDPDHPAPSRAVALLRRLREAAPRARLTELKGDRVFVVGPDDARGAVAAYLANLGDQPRATVFDVRFHQVAPAFANRLREMLPKNARTAGGALSWAVASARESREVEFLLRTAQGEVAARDTTVAAPPTGRGDAARIVRTPYRAAPGTGAAGTWGRSDAAWIDEGLVVSLRPFGRTKDGGVDIDVAARARWIADAGRRDARTPLGSVPVFDPRTESWWGDVSAPLARGETLVLFGARSPFAAGGPEHVVVTVRIVE